MCRGDRKACEWREAASQASYKVGVELGQPRLAMVVEDENAVNHACEDDDVA